MDLNANFDERAIVHAGGEEWIPSPMQGVDRRMLDRIGDEVARATSIVRYAPGSHFSAHTHTGGEEFLVLEGVFQDEHGDYPAGTYVRNPPTSSHTPGAEAGCVIFVKLWQFDPEDRNQFSVDTLAAKREIDPNNPAIERLELHSDAHEAVSMEWWQAGAEITLDAPKGMEVLVVNGSFTEAAEAFEYQSWLRLPVAGSATVTAGPNGCTVWVKRNHLAIPPSAPTTA